MLTVQYLNIQSGHHEDSHVVTLNYLPLQISLNISLGETVQVRGNIRSVPQETNLKESSENKKSVGLETSQDERASKHKPKS